MFETHTHTHHTSISFLDDFYFTLFFSSFFVVAVIMNCVFINKSMLVWMWCYLSQLSQQSAVHLHLQNWVHVHWTGALKTATCPTKRSWNFILVNMGSINVHFNGESKRIKACPQVRSCSFAVVLILKMVVVFCTCFLCKALFVVVEEAAEEWHLYAKWLD